MIVNVPVCFCVSASVHTPVHTCRGQRAACTICLSVHCGWDCLRESSCAASAFTCSISLVCVQRSRSAVVDDEDDPAEAEKEGNEMEDEELDPLDAYMEEVKEEVKKFNMRSVKGGAGNEKVRGRLALVTCHLKVIGLFTLGDHKEGS